MGVFLLVIAAAACASLVNLFLRKSSSTKEATHQFLWYYYLASFIGSFLIRPDQIVDAWDMTMFVIGCGTGILNVAMMLITSRALQQTPAGITFTFQNASSVFPTPILSLLLGPSFGFIVTGHQIAGMSLILLGLFSEIVQSKQRFGTLFEHMPQQLEKLPSENNANLDSTKKIGPIYKYALGCFLVQTAILCIFQGRLALLPDETIVDSDVWFMIGFFGMALLFQSFLFFRHIPKQPAKSVSIFGSISGLANTLSTYFLLQATLFAAPQEGGLIFPLFAVSVIMLCNLWGYWLYQERPKTALLALCSSGIIVASLG